ncbi:hypothetical protein CONPUDRAFT_45075 [Coniophora puteana RWD-64-598 SS2]|uniref:Mediator of RNA polymerase II transcription subunit 9 n=1 Tax=Coniophora puteana (strain RWD-64-598) TaxID=741705 RepID=A0A5M3N457_CONPW|nr:uncharacterized protein CONPUDRAFT_45075 [Coniophora puteana RWD-64-598 SS2]EIW86209.1 hypothetical protein CONPUDRAFT_45075 [Coniophora puteana RWD-64-598 SS2]
MSTSTIPSSLFESLYEKLSVVLQLTQSSEGVTTPQARQALLQATNDFKNALSQAKDYASSLPGGELSVMDQDEVIEMLTKLKEHKREQLAQFSSRALGSDQPTDSTEGGTMDIDSTASTPVAS